MAAGRFTDTLDNTRKMATMTWLQLFTFIFLRYAIAAFIGYFVFYLWKRNTWAFKKIQARFPLPKDLIREIGYSLITAIIFSGVGYAVFFTPLRAYTQLYAAVSDMGWGYFVFSIFLMLLIHDTYFYWTHRAMHHPAIFKWMHRVHHLSVNPSPWAAYAFHPLESVVEAGVMVLIVLVIPAHPAAIGLFLLVMIFYNVYGHLGYELYPRGFSTTRVGKWINTSVSHNEHHQFFQGNYGLYFLWWDRWMGTLCTDYSAHFEQITTGRG